MMDAVCETELKMTWNEQPYVPEDGVNVTALLVTFHGPHDFLRVAAELCEAVWTEY